MSNFVRKNGIFMAIVVVLVILCMAMIGISVVNSNAAAEAASGEIEDAIDITIGHITDTHYYPYRFGYYGDITSSTDDGFFYNYIMETNTKLWLEAEAVFETALLAIKDNAPEYLVLSGDVGQDGEFMSHIDVANQLRQLQNDIREDYGNDSFQIFVVMGNHDLYNPESWRFDNDTGIMEKSYYTTRMDVTTIYAGLGYPNISTADATEYYSYIADDMVGHEFVQSYLSSDFNWAWEFINDDDEGNTRVFTYDSDATDSEKEQLSMSNFLSLDYVSTVNNADYFDLSGQCYKYENFGDAIDLDVGMLTYIAQRKDNKFTVLGLDVVLSNPITGHILGGQLQNYTQDWMTKNSSFAKYDDDTVIVGICHHSVLPHWGMEEEITTGFILYNWEEVSDFLADYGMRYIYTGHMHANDTVSKVSFNGNQIIDLENSACVSVGSSIKIMRIHHGVVGDCIAEQTYLKSIDNTEVYYPALFDDVFADDKYGYVADNKIEEYLDYDTKTITDYSGYALRRVYENAVADKLNAYLQPSVTDMIKDIVSGIEFNVSFLTISLDAYSDDLVALANNLITEISTKVLTDYTYTGTNATYYQEEYKLFGYLEDLINDICFDELAEDIGIYTLVIDAYASHCAGTDVSSISELSEAKQEALNKIYSGEFIDNVIQKLLDGQTGLYRLIVGLEDTTLDLSEGISDSFNSLISMVGGILGFDSDTFELDLSSFNLGDVLAVAGKSELVNSMLAKTSLSIDLSTMSLTEIIDDIVDKYLTESFEKALGEYAYDVITAFAVDDDDVDCTSGEEMLLTIKDYDDEDSQIYTYIQKTRTEIATVDNGKLPSMITTNFGSDDTTSENFTYFTDRRVTQGGIEYVEVAEDGTYSESAATYQDATNEIYGTSTPLIDLGIWCQEGYVEIGRHTISLTDLEPDTTYAYRVGAKDSEYWSDWFEFTTAPADTTSAFEVLIGADLQSSTEYAYERLSTVYDQLDEVFTDDIAFMINAGDAVDNGCNLSQYEWWLNSATEFYASTATVICSGNHDVSSFDVASTSNRANYGGVTDIAYNRSLVAGNISDTYGTSEDAITSAYNFLESHFNYDLTDEQSQLTGFYYSFDYSGVHFTVLNTNDYEDDVMSEAQVEWLEADLDAAADKIKVVIMHKSLYSAGSHSYDSEVVGMRAQLTPIFDEKGVSLVIGGHDHTYTETYYMDAEGNKILTDANGKNELTGEHPLYVTMGTLGEKYYTYTSNPDVPVNTGESLHEDGCLSDSTFGKLVYDGTTLSYYGYQYVCELNELGDIVGEGEIVEINKSLDWDTLIAIGMLGVIVVLIFVTIIVSIVKNKKNKKVMLK
jgi:3',5'-cyclic AMP phosphodiesterase CpdA